MATNDGEPVFTGELTVARAPLPAGASTWLAGENLILVAETLSGREIGNAVGDLLEALERGAPVPGVIAGKALLSRLPRQPRQPRRRHS